MVYAIYIRKPDFDFRKPFGPRLSFGINAPRRMMPTHHPLNPDVQISIILGTFINRYPHQYPNQPGQMTSTLLYIDPTAAGSPGQLQIIRTSQAMPRETGETSPDGASREGYGRKAAQARGTPPRRQCCRWRWTCSCSAARIGACAGSRPRPSLPRPARGAARAPGPGGRHRAPARVRLRRPPW